MYIDSHCHLNRDEFPDVDEVIQRAKAVGIEKMLTICTSIEEAQQVIDLAGQYDELYCSLGVHPHDAHETLEKYDLTAELNKYCNAHKVIAIGETGLDFYYENSPKVEQIKAFDIHIDVAASHKLPLIVHTRDADIDTMACLTKQKGNITGVMHCFSGTKELAQQALDLGFYISISGIVTFKKADELREVVKYVPLDRLLVETDSPFLAPIPHRGKRNEPSFMIETIKKVAELKDISVQELGDITTANFNKLFKTK